MRANKEQILAIEAILAIVFISISIFAFLESRNIIFNTSDDKLEEAQSWKAKPWGNKMVVPSNKYSSLEFKIICILLIGVIVQITNFILLGCYYLIKPNNIAIFAIVMCIISMAVLVCRFMWVGGGHPFVLVNIKDLYLEYLGIILILNIPFIIASYAIFLKKAIGRKEEGQDKKLNSSIPEQE